MAIAIRSATRLQDQDDVNVTPGAGVDDYVLTYDHGTGKFILAAASAPTGYLLATGATTGATSQAQTFTNGIIGPSWRPASDSTTSFRINKANEARAFAFDTSTTWNRFAGDTATPYIILSDSYGTEIAYGSTCTLYLGGPIFYTTGGVQRMGIESSGPYWVGVRRLDYTMQVTGVSGATNVIVTNFALSNRSTGTPAAGSGSRFLYELHSSTTTEVSAATIDAVWYEATHATRKADLVLSVYDTAEREGLRIRGNGSAAAIGFLGAAPAARQSHIADATNAADVITRANAIIAALETFGLLATS